MRSRLRAVLPPRWFPDTAPVLDGLLTGLANAWAALYVGLGYVRQQTRIGTATDCFLDLAAADYFGTALGRRDLEADDPFRNRILKEMTRERATRAAVTAALTDLTGRAPAIFEPARAADTGAWNMALGYNTAGGWGSLNLPFQALVTAYRPEGGSLANLAGWGTATENFGAGGWGEGAFAYASAAMIAAPITDADIYGAVAAVIPVATIAWTRIEN
jgi:hypothetical protein